MKKLKFSGSRWELQQIVKKLNGKFESENEFHCIHKIQNRWDVSKPSGISFRIDCTVSGAPPGLEIRYRIRPTIGTLFLPWMLLLVLAICIAAGFYGESWVFTFIFSALSAISLMTMAYYHQKCTHRFLNAFTKRR